MRVIRFEDGSGALPSSSRAGGGLDRKAPAARSDAIRLIIAGATGRVGSALCRQLASMEPARSADGATVEVTGIANRTKTLLDEKIDPARAAALLCRGRPTNWATSLERLAPSPSSLTLFVDCTASDEVAALYGPLLERGIGVVTANKIALAGPLAIRDALGAAALERGVPLLYETTVGAALPLLGSIRDLVMTGDRILSISAVLSGTLSYILGRLHAGARFSAAVCDAYAKGLTEPDPAVDLSGQDVARKLLILVRQSGAAVDSGRLRTEALPGGATSFDGNLESYRRSLEVHDDAWEARVRDAVVHGKRLVYAASFDERGLRAAIEEIDAEAALARARPGENVIVIRTARDADVPLTIAGPGAGPEITAAGLLAEILNVQW
jgi:homoserine dehydrogenase